MFTAAEIADMIATEGVSGTFVSYASEVYDRATGEVTRTGRTEHPVVVIPPNADGKVVKQFGDVDGVKEARLFSVVAASGLAFEPAVGQEFVWEGQSWILTWVNPIRSNAGVLAYQFGIKGKA